MFWILTLLFFSSDTGDLTWGHLEDTEVYGRKAPADDFIEIDRNAMKDKSEIKCEASHCLIYAKNNKKVFDVYSPRAVILVCCIKSLSNEFYGIIRKYGL